MTYSATTHGIKITVFPTYSEDKSSPHDNHYVWIYTIYIENTNPYNVQLLSRYWQVVDAEGGMQEVQGEGVVGKQPQFLSGEVFEYSSQVYLPLPSGMMMGTYTMINQETGVKFDAEIPAFSLDIPEIRMLLN